MAKRKKHEEEEPVGFTPPEFDERDFMEKEAKKTKGALVTIAYAVGISICSFGMTLAGEPALGALLGIAALALINFVYMLVEVDTKIFEKKDWLGNGVIYFFTWLGIWILLCNPPFSDFAHPSIGHVEVYGEETLANGQGVNETVTVLRNESNAHYLINEGENVTIKARVTDNVGVEDVGLAVAGLPSPTFLGSDDHVYSWIIHDVRILGNATSHKYDFTISASDSNGNDHSWTGSFTVY